MRFKQMKPLHVRKKERTEDQHESCNGITHVQLCNILTNCDAGDCVDGDCVDGDVNPKKLRNQESPVRSTLKPQNGHDSLMEVSHGPDLYSSGILNTSEALHNEHLYETAAPLATEQDIIIHGRRPIFSESEEAKIAGKMNEWQEQGIKYTRMDVVKMASEYAIHLGKRPQSRPLTVKWFRSFLTRHPEFYAKKMRTTKSEKSKEPNIEKQYFDNLEKILITYNMKESPHCIFSLVELPLSMLKNGKFCTGENDSVDSMKSHGKLTFVGKVPSSVLICGSAAGQALPPFLLFAGKTMEKSLLSGLTPGAGGMACPSGRATPDVLLSFLRDHFLSQAPGRAGDTLILLLDAKLSSCLSQAVIDLGTAFKVVIVTAPVKFNPQLHPLVVGCCDTFQQELFFGLQKPQFTCESLSSAFVCETLCRIYHRSLSAEYLHASFKKTGIYPFNPPHCQKDIGAISTSLGLVNPWKGSDLVSKDLKLHFIRNDEVEEDMGASHINDDRNLH